jgi:hypothetical protein
MTRSPILIATTIAVTMVSSLTAQTAPEPSPTRRVLPRTPDGRPDFQGVWDYRTATPLERPRELGTKAYFTPEEAADFERRTASRRETVQAVHAPGWLDYGARVLPDLRTSLIVDPPDGRIPPLTPEAQKRTGARAATRTPTDGPETFSPQERCLVFGAGPPLVPGPYNNNIQIVQTPTAVVISNEMIHDARIVTIAERSPLPAAIRRWLGDSRGRWDGDTFVIETARFTDQTSFRGSDERLRVVERISLAGPDTLAYEFTIDNPSVFTRPWTASFTMARTPERIYEYACHEGNYGMMNALKTARVLERQAGSAPTR